MNYNPILNGEQNIGDRRDVRMISFIVRGRLAGAGSKTTGFTKAGRTFVRPASKYTKPWMKLVAAAATKAMSDAGLKPASGPVAIDFIFVRAMSAEERRNARKGRIENLIPDTSRPDLTKLIRATEDAMKGIVFYDDGQVYRQVSKKFRSADIDSRESESCMVTVRFSL